MTSEAIEESGVNVFMFALALGSGTARRFESNPTDANEPSGIGQIKPGRRTATVRRQPEPRLLFLHHAIRAMRELPAASHFGRVCAGSLTRRAGRDREGGSPNSDFRRVGWGGDQKRLNPVANLQRFLNAN